MQTSAERDGALDLFRYITVTFAVLSHIILAHNMYGESLVGWVAVAKSVTRTATPALLVLFGMMVELVYSRRYSKDRAATAGALIYRSILCYGALLALAVAQYLSDGEWDLARLLASVPMIAPVNNADIFKLYAFLLLLTYPILWIRNRFGVLGLCAFVLLCWSFFYLFLDNLPALPFPLHHIGGVLFGIGDQSGPSVLHATLFMIFGMVVTNALKGGANKLRFARAAAGVVALAALIFMIVSVWQYGFFGVAERIADISQWRMTNHIGYYAFGITAAILLLAIAYGLFSTLPASMTEWARQIGGVTLFYYFTANILLAAAPHFVLQGWSEKVVLALSYLVVLSLLARWWALRGRKSSWIARLNREVPAAIAARVAAIRGALGRRRAEV